MTPLTDALTAAQARAVSALAKQYVRGGMTRDAVKLAASAFGLTDEIDQEFWLNALDVIKDAGADAPGETRPSVNGKDEAATEAQLKLIARLCDDKGMTAPDGPLTKQQAHEVIDGLKAGAR